MKKITILMLLIILIGNIGAVDTESYQFVDHLLGLSGPGEPEIYEDGVLFTASSSYRRVGIAFAHEGFAKVYWFQKLLITRDDIIPGTVKFKDPLDAYRDSGILFHLYPVPRDLRELEYRLIIDGLWTVDPLNPRYRMDRQSGIVRSTVPLPEIERPPSPFDGPPGSLSFSYRAPPGESITVAGNFNGWDPFMYELRETAPGIYALTLPLPPGVYHYVFFHRGRRMLDPNNHNRIYTAEGKTASEAVVP
jgi:hypothetical protein